MSVVVAVLIGGIEGLGLIGGQLGLEGGFWEGIGALNDSFNGIGFVIVGVFIFAWIASVIFYRYARLNHGRRPDGRLSSFAANDLDE